VPDEIERAFSEAFSGENRSTVIARLMQQAVEDRQRQRRRTAAIAALLAQRRAQQPMATAKVAMARRLGRP
jgi:hypothetical protein